MNRLKLFIVAMGLIVVIGGAAILYIFFSTGRQAHKELAVVDEESGKNTTPLVKSLPKSEDVFENVKGETISRSEEKERLAKKVKKIVPASSMLGNFSPFGENVLFFDRNIGMLKTIDRVTGEVKEILNIKRTGFQSMVLSGNGKFAYFSLSERGMKTTYLLNIDSQEYAKVADKWIAYDFNEDGNSVLYNYFDSKTNQGTITVADLDGGNFQSLLSTASRYLELFYVDSEKIYFYPSPLAVERYDLTKIDAKTRQVDVILPNFSGITVRKTGKKENILVSVDSSSGNNVDLFLIHTDSEKILDLKLKTLAKKCSNEVSGVIFCFVPKENVRVKDYTTQYENSEIKTDDELWKVEVEAAKPEFFMNVANIIDTSIDAVNPYLTSDGKNLYFSDKATEDIYQVQVSD